MNDEATVQLMTSNHLAASVMMEPGLGWGYDCAVYADPQEASVVAGKGTFFWWGAADTWFWVDPMNDVVFVGMTQRLFGPRLPDVEALSQPVVYQALVKRQI